MYTHTINISDECERKIYERVAVSHDDVDDASASVYIVFQQKIIKKKLKEKSLHMQHTKVQ